MVISGSLLRALMFALGTYKLNFEDGHLDRVGTHWPFKADAGVIVIRDSVSQIEDVERKKVRSA